MKLSDIPSKFTIPFANGAGGGYIRTIPTPSQIGITNGAASLTDGFPPLTFLPVGSGGVPPFGQDFNGILNQISAWSRWQGAGGLATYDNAFSTAIGGYPRGAILAGTSAGVVWLNLVDNNTTNPDSGGANWLSFAMAVSNRWRLINTQIFNTPGASTYTPTSGTTFVDVECQGGGGPGAGAPATGAGQVSVGGGGTGGSYVRGQFTTGFSGITITVGAGGVPASGGIGTSGGNSSFGSLLVAPGGPVSQVSGPITPPTGVAGVQGILSTGGYVNGSGVVGGISLALNANLGGFGGNGGPGHWGGGGTSVPNSVNGIAGNAPGSAGSGTSNIQSSGALTGGAGAAGIVIVHEYGQ